MEKERAVKDEEYKKKEEEKRRKEDAIVEEEKKKKLELEKRKAEEEKKKQEIKKNEEKKKLKINSDSDDDDEEDEKDPKDVKVIKKSTLDSSDEEDQKKPVKKEEKKPEKEESSDDEDSKDSDDNGDVQDERVDPSTVPKPKSIKDALQQMDDYVTEESIVERSCDLLERKMDDDINDFNEKFIEFDGIQNSLSVLEVHYKNSNITKFLVPVLLSLCAKDESRQHLCRLMNGLISLSRIFTNQEPDSLDVPLSRDIMILLSLLVKKKNDYTTNYMKDKELVKKVVQLSDNLSRRSLEFAKGLSDFVQSLCSLDATYPVQLYEAGILSPMIKVLKKHTEEYPNLIISFFYLICGLKGDPVKECAEQFASECLENIITTILPKFQEEINVQNSIYSLIQKISFNKKALEAIINAYKENEMNLDFALQISKILLHLVQTQKQIPDETLQAFADSKLVLTAGKLLTLHKKSGWIISYCVSFLLFMVEKIENKETLSKITDEIVKSNAFEGIFFGFQNFSRSDEVMSVSIKLLDELSHNDGCLIGLSKTPGFVNQMLTFINENRGSDLQYTGFAILQRFASKIELDKDLSSEMIDFMMKILTTEKEMTDASTRCLECLYPIVKGNPFDISVEDSRLLLANIKHNSTDNEDFVKALFLFLGEMGKSNKNRQTLITQKIVEELKNIHKSYSKNTEVMEAAKEAIKTLGI